LKPIKWKLLGLVLALICISILAAILIPSFGGGSLISRYNAENLEIKACTLTDMDLAMKTENIDGAFCYINDPSELEIIEEFLSLNWKPKYFGRKIERNLNIDMYISFHDSDLSFTVDCINPSTIRIFVDGDNTKNSSCIFSVKTEYDIEKIRDAANLPAV